MPFHKYSDLSFFENIYMSTRAGNHWTPHDTMRYVIGYIAHDINNIDIAKIFKNRL